SFWCTRRLDLGEPEAEVGRPMYHRHADQSQVAAELESVVLERAATQHTRAARIGLIDEFPNVPGHIDAADGARARLEPRDFARVAETALGRVAHRRIEGVTPRVD